jgi:uncharacterized protein YukE
VAADIPIPNYYDAVKIRVDTGGLAYAVDQIRTAAETIADNLGTINKTLSGLALNWTGDSASQAQQFNDEWNSAVQLLFGVVDSQGNVLLDDGAISVLVEGLDKAVSNYRFNEQAVINLFNAFTNLNPNPNANANPVPNPNSVDDKPSVRPYEVNGTTLTQSTTPGDYLFHTTAVDEDF